MFDNIFFVLLEMGYFHTFQGNPFGYHIINFIIFSFDFAVVLFIHS